MGRGAWRPPHGLAPFGRSPFPPNPVAPPPIRCEVIVGLQTGRGAPPTLIWRPRSRTNDGFVSAKESDETDSDPCRFSLEAERANQKTLSARGRRLRSGWHPPRRHETDRPRRSEGPSRYLRDPAGRGRAPILRNNRDALRAADPSTLPRSDGVRAVVCRAD